MLKKKQLVETFNSGVLQICIKEDKRIKKNLIDGILRYSDITLGVTRFYEARIADSSISKVVAVPYQDVLNNDERSKYAVLIDSKWYEVDMIQKKFDSFVPKCILTLKKGGIKLIDERSGN